MSRDKRITHHEAIASLRSGMTIGIGGWGSRRKPMSLVRALLNSDLTDLTIVSYGGPDVGLLAAAGKIRRLVYGFVSLDSIPLEPHFRSARQGGTIPECVEYDEGMLQARIAANKERQTVVAKAKTTASSILGDAEAKAAQELQAGRQSIDSALQQAYAKAEGEAQILADSITSKVDSQLTVH